MSKRIESVFYGKDRELLPLLLEFYGNPPGTLRDVSANTRKMWKSVDLSQWEVLFYDIDEAVSPDVVTSWDALPDDDSSVDVLVYDPPHLPVAAASPKSLQRFAAEYGLNYGPDADGIQDTHTGFLGEASRVLTPDGIALCKIKDYVHNHKYQWNLASLLLQAEKAGLTPCDLIIKRDPSGGSLKSSRWVKTHHARNCHVYWLILRNGKCERR